MAIQEESTLNRLSIYRELLLREYDMVIERSNMFLVYHSILMAGFALGSNAPRIVEVLPFFGLAASLMWLHIGYRTITVADHLYKKVTSCEESLPEEDRIYSQFLSWRRKEKPPIFRVRLSSYFGIGFPILWAITWSCAILLASETRAAKSPIGRDESVESAQNPAAPADQKAPLSSR